VEEGVEEAYFLLQEPAALLELGVRAPHYDATVRL